MVKPICGQSELSSAEKKLVVRVAYVLFGVLSVHFVLVALWLLIVQRAQGPLFGQVEEVSGVKVAMWSVLLLCCGVSGVLVLVLKSVQAAKFALGCWLLLLTIHTWYLAVVTFSSIWPSAEENIQSWSMNKIVVQLLTDFISMGFLVWFICQGGDNDSARYEFLREPLVESLRDEV